VCGRSGRAAQYVQTFRTTAADLLVLRDWLAAHGVTGAIVDQRLAVPREVA
jgi:hypothetical protein